MRIPRFVRFREMWWYDHTRPTEWWNGVGLVLAGVWMYFWYIPPTWQTASELWQYIGPGWQGAMLVVLGTAQTLAAGTKWVGLRRNTAVAAAAVVVYAFVVYVATAPRTFATPLLGWLAVRELWVGWRIIHDRTVNGADRRGKERPDDVAR